MDIQDLADFVTLEHLARSLWHDGESRGAALMVGAGFSRLAKLTAPSARRPPLWNDLRARMVSEIYAGTANEKAPNDPLRLAEEYQALLGRAALNDFIRNQVPDQMWEPSDVHASLIRLPWSDILTTNWDSLLERTVPLITEIGYETVSVASDIARAKSPRIIKLHGNVPAGPFIFTEEDYRTYPVRHAPFVNLARQIFLENELCLLGFSGTDPNFIQWSGWVRDNLGDSSRRIYLVGVLDLNPAARRLLESRNVAPIDLSPIVREHDRDDKHNVAISRFLSFLHEAKPVADHAWTPKTQPELGLHDPDAFERRQRDPAYAADLLESAALQWQAERETYPGWVVCPYSKRDELRRATDLVPMPSKDILARIDAKHRARVLYELAWRFDVSFWRIPDFVFDLMQEFAAPDANSGLSKSEHLTLASILLRTARENGARKTFDSLAKIIEFNSEAGSDFRAMASYQKCLWNRDHFDLLNLSKELSQLSGVDPMWALRRAGLHCDLAEYDKADELIRMALNDLRARQRRDRKSLWVLSRRGWAQFLDRASERGFRIANSGYTDRARYDEWPLEFKVINADPWDELAHIEEIIRTARLRQSEDTFDVKAHFDAGTYTERGERLQFTSWTIESPRYALDRLAEAIGIPISIDMVSILALAYRDAAPLEFELSEAWYLRLLRTLRGHDDASLERFFSRNLIAQLPEDIVPTLVDRLTAAIDFFRHRSIKSADRKKFNIRVIEKLRLQFEVLSRLAVRLSPEHAKRIYELADGLSKDSELRHHLLFEGLGHLLKRSGEAMPPALRAELVLSAVEFPVQGEIAISAPPRWPEPLSYIANCPLKEPIDKLAWNRRIERLLELTHSEQSLLRESAALKLFYLDNTRLLSPVQRDNYGQALWSQTNQEKSLPSKTALLPSAFLRIPAPDPSAPLRYFKDVLFKASGSNLLTEQSLAAIADAATPDPRAEALTPEHEHALRIFEEILALKAPQSEQRHEIGSAYRRKLAARQIGPVLTKAIMPVLKSTDYTPDRVDSLFRLIETEIAPSALQALPFLAEIERSAQEKVIKLIRRALTSRHDEQISSAAIAVDHWASVSTDASYPLPMTIPEQVVTAISHRRGIGLSSLLWCARRLLNMGKLPRDQQALLIEALRDLLEETKYNQIEPGDKQEIALSFVRAECVKLARKLSDVGITDNIVEDWLSACKTDPLPEVKWALTEGMS